MHSFCIRRRCSSQMGFLVQAIAIDKPPATLVEAFGGKRAAAREAYELPDQYVLQMFQRPPSSTWKVYNDSTIQRLNHLSQNFKSSTGNEVKQEANGRSLYKLKIVRHLRRSEDVAYLGKLSQKRMLDHCLGFELSFNAGRRSKWQDPRITSSQTVTKKQSEPITGIREGIKN